MSMIDQNVPVQAIASHVKKFGVSDYDEQMLQQARSLNQDLVFSMIRKYCSFLDIDLLENIAQNCGNDVDIGKVEKYKEYLNAFCNTRLSEMPRSRVLLSTDKERDQIMTTVNLCNPTLRQIKDFKINLCKLLSLEPHCLQVMEIECIKENTRVTFLILEYNSIILINECLTEAQQAALDKLSVFHIICFSVKTLSLTILCDVTYCILIEACKNPRIPIATVTELIRGIIVDMNHPDKVRFDNYCNFFDYSN